MAAGWFYLLSLLCKEQGILLPLLVFVERRRSAERGGDTHAVTAGPALWFVAALTIYAVLRIHALGAAVVSTTVAFITFLRGLAALGAVRTAILSTVEPFWTALLAALVLGQPLTRSTMLGGAAIIAAILLLQRSAHPAIPDAPPPE